MLIWIQVDLDQIRSHIGPNVDVVSIELKHFCGLPHHLPPGVMVTSNNMAVIGIQLHNETITWQHGKCSL